MSEFVETTTIERTIACRACGSTDLVKDGLYGSSQYFLCRKCESKSAGTHSFPRMKHPRDRIVRAITNYFGGMSYRAISESFGQLEDSKVSKSSILNWVLKYSRLVNGYTLALRPQLSDIWVADETAVFLWGEQYWFWDAIDAGTGFLIASHLSRTRSMEDAIKFFSMARWRSQTRPRLVLTDKMGAYYRAFNKVFYSSEPAHRVAHLTSEGFASESNINLIERFHGTLKRRAKVMRDLKTKPTARIVLDGFVTNYNFLTHHGALKGRTPAQVANVGREIESWDDLIELGLRTPRQNPSAELEWHQKFRIG
jgi:transposase-like protein